jgi:hypothetical protein
MDNYSDSFDALDFGDEPGHGSGYDTGAALDFGDEVGGEAGGDAGRRWDMDDLPADGPDEPARGGTEPRAIDTLPGDTAEGEGQPAGTEDDEFDWEKATVANPLETVSVTAIMDGRIHNVELSPEAATMTESELAAEVLALADLASQKATSVLHRLLMEGVKAQGLDTEGTFTELLGARFLDLASPQEATAAQTEVFAARYSG